MKKTLSLFLIAVLTLSMFTGCSKSKENDGDLVAPLENNQTISSDANLIPTYYSENYYPFQGGYTVKDVARIDNKLLIMGEKDSQSILGLAEYTCSDMGEIVISDSMEILLDSPSDENEAMIYDVAAGGDGLFYVLTGSLPEEYTGNFALLQYAEDGSFKNKMQIDDFTADVSYGISVAVGNQGNIILQCDKSTFSLTWGSNYGNEQTVESGYYTCAVNTSKGIVVSIHNSALDGSPFFLADSQNGNLTRLNVTNTINPAEDVDGFKKIWGGSESICQGLNGEFISNSGESFVLFDFDNDSYNDLFQWNYSGLEALSACRVSENSYVCAIANSDSLLITGMKYTADSQDQKSIVHTAVVGLEWDAHIPEMNNKSTKYEYEAKFYDINEADKLLTELSTGDGIDLVLFNTGINTSSSTFENLSPYIDKDPDLSSGVFLPNLLESMSVHGEIHQLWDQVAIRTLAGRQSLLNDGHGLTIDDYVRLVEENVQIKGVFDTFMSKEDLLAYVANIGVSVFSDKNNKSCNFKDDNFAKLLEWCKYMGDGTPEGSGGVTYEANEYILNPVYLTTPITDTYIESADDYISYVGFPNGADGYHFYLPFESMGLAMAIPARSQNKDGA